MSKRFASAWGLLLMLLPAPSFAADIHSVFTSWSSWYGRIRTDKAEMWIAADRECQIKSHETRIIRKDLGLMWRMPPNAKTYNEYPLKADGAPAPAVEKPRREERQPAGKDGKEDLRFVGHFGEPVFEWNTRLLGDEVVQGQTCKVYSIRGEADFAEVDMKLWISPDGKSKGLAVPEEFIFGTMYREQSAVEAIAKIMAGYPNGGIVQLEKRSDPPIGPESKAKITLDTYEIKEPPAGIYEIPAGVQKEEGKKP